MVIDEAAQEMILKERQWYRENDAAVLAKLKEEGVQFTSPSRQPFAEASRTVYRDWADRIGGMDLIEKIIQFDYK